MSKKNYYKQYILGERSKMCIQQGYLKRFCTKLFL